MVLPVRLPNWIHSFITIANHFLGVSGKGEPQNYPGSWSLSGKAIVLAAPINASKFNSFYKHYTYYSYYSSTHLANIFYNHDCNHPIISNHFQFHSVFRSPFLSFHNCPPKTARPKTWRSRSPSGCRSWHSWWQRRSCRASNASSRWEELCQCQVSWKKTWCKTGKMGCIETSETSETRKLE